MNDNPSKDPLFGDLDEATLLESKAPDASTSSSSTQERRLAQLAINLRDNAAAGWLSWVMSSTLGEQVDPDAFLVYRDVLLKEAGDPQDPIERMLIEQLALAHFSIGQMRIRSCSTDSPKMTLAFSDAATRLFSEFRRSVLALEEYRSKRALRTEQRDRHDEKTPVLPAEANGHVRPRVHASKKHRDVELESTEKQTTQVLILDNNINGDMPKWLKNRLACPTPCE